MITYNSQQWRHEFDGDAEAAKRAYDDGCIEERRIGELCKRLHAALKPHGFTFAHGEPQPDVTIDRRSGVSGYVCLNFSVGDAALLEELIRKYVPRSAMDPYR